MMYMKTAYIIKWHCPEQANSAILVHESLLAIEKATKMILLSNSDCYQVAIFTDALSVLQALKNGKLPQLRKELSKIAARRRTILQWVPSHCGVPGNERADIYLQNREQNVSKKNVK